MVVTMFGPLATTPPNTHHNQMPTINLAALKKSISLKEILGL